MGVAYLKKTSASVVPTSGMTAWYKFNNDYLDSSVNGNDITAHQYIEFDTSGAFDYCIKSIATNPLKPQLTMPSGVNASFLTGNDFSISFWVSTNSFTSPGTYSLIFQGVGGVGNLFISILDTSGKIRFLNRTQYLDSVLGLTLNKWQHVVCTLESSVDMKIYIDGVIDSSAGSSYSTVSPTTCYILGTSPSSLESREEKIDDIIIYDRVLTPDDIATMYANTTRLKRINQAPV